MAPFEVGIVGNILSYWRFTKVMHSLFPGIGPKTSLNLIKKHGNLEAALESLDKEKNQYVECNNVVVK